MNSNIILLIGGLLSSLVVYFCLNGQSLPTKSVKKNIKLEKSIPTVATIESNKTALVEKNTKIVENNITKKDTNITTSSEQNKTNIDENITKVVENNTTKSETKTEPTEPKPVVKPIIKKAPAKKVKKTIDTKKPQKEINKLLRRHPIHFKFDSGRLTSGGKRTLSKIAKILKTTKAKLDIRVEGHTDGYGNPNYNILLSQKRANAVKSYLKKHSKNIHSIVAKGYGFKKPKYKSRKDRRNRRVEIIITKGIR